MYNNQTLHSDNTQSNYIELAIYLVLLVVGVPLNISAFISLVKNLQYTGHKPQFLSMRRFLLLKLHLNIADIFILVFHAVTYTFWLGTFSWLGGNVLCKVLRFFDIFSFYLCSNVVVCIAVDRVFTTKTMTRINDNQKAHRRTKIILLVAYVHAFCTSLPQLVIWRTAKIPGASGNSEQCTTVWTIQKSNQGERIATETYYAVFSMAQMFWIPAIFIVGSHIYMAYRVNRVVVKAPSSVRPRIKLNQSDVELKTYKSSSNSNDLEQLKNLMSDGITALHRAAFAPANTVCLTTSRAVSPSLYETQFLVSGEPDSPEVGCSRATSEMAISSSHQNDLKDSNVEPQIMRMELYQMPNTHIITAIPEHRPKRSHRFVSIRKRIRASISTIHMGRMKSSLQKKTLKQFVMIVFAYILCWFPFNLIMVCEFVDPTLFTQKMESFRFLEALIVLNAVINPLIYRIPSKYQLKGNGQEI